ncbi:TetR/AcrR family transcriptional regulator [Amycolatopsis sp. NPDC004079]|uniref:TetR/AcrR family transcriptional regulator n=1 Tax=Amycolatopsis sp. NPDC004079 TaxID=3154549 RepID=UPI0033A3A828
MEARVPSRRERLRAEASQEIKAIALRLMTEGGPSAISLRAIAREMGMTAGALYGYYATRDDLVNALIAEIYSALAGKEEAARDAVPEDDPEGRVLAVGEAFRDWAVSRPEEFQLIYGDPLPGYQAPEGGAAADAEHRACAVLTGLVADAWPHASKRLSDDGYDWADFDPGFAAVIRGEFPDLPPAAVALAMRVWGRMHGLVALEVYGHLRPQVLDPGRLYRAELLDLTKTLGITPADRAR